MKKLKLFAIALVAVFGLNSCSKECGHDFIQVDYSKDLVGTWTCLEPDYAAAYVFNADGTIVTTGVSEGQYWEDFKGTWTVVNNKLTLDYEGVESEFLLEIIPGSTMSLEDVNISGRTIFNYCKEDLSEEIVGMWVCTSGNSIDGLEDMVVQTYRKDGTSVFTGTALPDVTGVVAPNTDGYLLNNESTYKVIGDLLFRKAKRNVAMKLNYTPDGTALGDIMTTTTYLTTGNKVANATSSYLRINQTLELPGNRYDYKSAYVSNVKSKDMEFSVMGQEFSFANMNSSTFDAIMKTFLFSVEFPDKNTLNYSYNYYGVELPMSAPIAVKDNTMTIKMSEYLPGLKDVMLYAFQDVDCSQLHLYMHRNAFVNFFTNMVALMMTEGDEDFDITETINLIHEQIDDAVVSINLSIVMTNPTKAL